MEQLLDQYLVAMPLKELQWPQEVFTEELQQTILEKVIQSPLAVSHPPSHAYQVGFIKSLMTKTETGDSSIAESVYELYAGLLSIPTFDQSTTPSWKSYHLPNGEYVCLMESSRLISHGTTGLTTWQASLRFVEWFSSPILSSIFHSKRVLELGSGMGLTGLALCKTCSPLSYCFTDSHTLVLDKLTQNVLHNGTADGVAMEVVKVDWNSEVDISSLLNTHSLDYIIATDLTRLYKLPRVLQATSCSATYLPPWLLSNTSSSCTAMSWTLHIKELQGESVDVCLPNPSTATVLDVKNAYHRCEHTIPPYQQRLVIGKIELEDYRAVSSYPDLVNGTTIFLIRLIPFQLFVKGMDGSSHTISIPTKTPERYLVSHLKRLVEERTGVCPAEQRLQYGGKQLVDSCTLGDYNLVNNATLHLVARLRGGSIYAPSSTLIMSCGHSIRKSSLYTHCTNAVSTKKTAVHCPHCYSEWTVRSLKQHLSTSQGKEIEEGLVKNFCLSMPGVKSCDLCGGVWSDSSASGRICPSCYSKTKDDTQATLKVLAECETKTIGNAIACPAIRACPHCGKLINHTQDCRRVDCYGCKTTFCFNCLTIRPPTYGNGYYNCSESCSTARRQTVLPRI